MRETKEHKTIGCKTKKHKSKEHSAEEHLIELNKWKKSLESTPLWRISIKILNNDNTKLAHAGSKCSMPFFIGKQDILLSSLILFY